MKTFTTAAALASFVAGALAQGQLTIQTPPSVTECQPSQLSFSGGTGPYFLSILPGGQASATPLETLPQQAEAGAFTWNVDLPAGTQVTLQLKDSTGAIAFSSPIPIQPGSGGCVSNSSAASAASAAPSASAGASSGTSSGPPPASSSASSAASSSSSASSAASSSAPGGASSSAPPSNSGSGSAPAATSAGSDSGASGLSVGFSGIALAAAGILLRAAF